MESSTHAHQNPSFLEALRKVSLSLGLIAFIIFIGMYFEHQGFDKGYLVFANDSSERILNNLNLSFGVTRTYEHFAHKYEALAWYLAMFLAAELVLKAKSIKQISGITVVSLVICVSSLTLALNELRWLYVEKLGRLSESSLAEHFDDILRDSVPFDWISLFLVIVLLIIQIVFTYRYYSRWSSSKAL